MFPQFATHNAQTVAALLAMAGDEFYPGRYEFQCLHGMGEPLYEEVVGPDKLDRPCRIYAPVGSHETLLAYLVRRLLENGSNTSFVNRIADAAVTVDALVADPVALVRAALPLGAPHPRIALPRDLFGAGRANSAGLDLANEQRLASLAAGLLAGVATPWQAAPMLGDGTAEGPTRGCATPPTAAIWLVMSQTHRPPRWIRRWRRPRPPPRSGRPPRRPSAPPACAAPPT